MKDTVEKIYLMGLGAMQLTSEKASAVKDELLKAGEKVYNSAESMNKELRHDLMDKAKEKIVNDMTKEDVASKIEKLSDKDKAEILKLLKKDK